MKFFPFGLDQILNNLLIISTPFKYNITFIQAEQFFDESEDPIEHSCIWKLYDSNGERKKPYFLTFDSEIPHLNYLRNVNHHKIIAEMEKSQMNLEHYYFPL